MTFDVRVVPPSRRYDLGVDENVDGYDFASRVIVACGVLERTDAAFRVAGFGQDPWPVDVGYDLSTMLEDLPEVLDALRAGRNTAIDFYGQGIERLVEFVVDGDAVTARCTARSGGWTPEPAVEVVRRGDLVAMLERAYRDFHVGLRLASVEAAALLPESVLVHSRHHEFDTS